jgi:hypothetical protein
MKVNNEAHIRLNAVAHLEETTMREPLFRFGDFAIWSAILGTVIAYQLWSHTAQGPLTTALVVVGG